MNGVKQNQKIGINHKKNMHVNAHTSAGAHSEISEQQQKAAAAQGKKHNTTFFFVGSQSSAPGIVTPLGEKTIYTDF